MEGGRLPTGFLKPAPPPPPPKTSLLAPEGHTNCFNNK